jgi:hypothetical protein
MDMIVFALVAGIPVAALSAFVACWLVGDDNWDRAIAMLAGLIVVTLLAFRTLPGEFTNGEDDLENGILFFIGLIRSFFGWIVVTVATLLIHPHARQLVRRLRKDYRP